jgi:hypothetical protein
MSYQWDAGIWCRFFVNREAEWCLGGCAAAPLGSSGVDKINPTRGTSADTLSTLDIHTKLRTISRNC